MVEEGILPLLATVIRRHRTRDRVVVAALRAVSNVGVQHGALLLQLPARQYTACDECVRVLVAMLVACRGGAAGATVGWCARCCAAKLPVRRCACPRPSWLAPLVLACVQVLPKSDGCVGHVQRSQKHGRKSYVGAQGGARTWLLPVAVCMVCGMVWYGAAVGVDALLGGGGHKWAYAVMARYCTNPEIVTRASQLCVRFLHGRHGKPALCSCLNLILGSCLFLFARTLQMVRT